MQNIVNLFMGWSIFYSIILFLSCLACEKKDEKNLSYYDRKLNNLIRFSKAFQKKNYQELYNISQKLDFSIEQIQPTINSSFHQQYRKKLFSLIETNKWKQTQNLLKDIQNQEIFFLYENFINLCKGLFLLKTQSLTQAEFILLKKKEKDFFQLLKTLNSYGDFSSLEDYLKKNNYFKSINDISLKKKKKLEKGTMKNKIIFVCLGNICRSPMAEAIFSQLDKNNEYEVDSAGTSSFHIGSEPDYRTLKKLKEKNINYHHRAKQFTSYHFDSFDYIIAMDSSNYKFIYSLASNDKEKKKIHLMRNFDSQGKGKDVPDPYYGEEDGFELIYQILVRSCKNLLDFIKNKN